MGQLSFVSFVLVITTGIFQAFLVFKNHFNGYDLLAKKNQIVELKFKQSRLKQKVAEYQLQYFRQEVAAIMPDFMQAKGYKEEQYPLRTLSSVLKKPSEQIDQALGKSTFLQAKRLFKQRQFEEAQRIFVKFIELHSYSVHIAEAHFLLAESYYQMDLLDDAVRTIEEMVKVFPSNDLTGLALIRLGSIFKNQERTDEATILFKTVLQTFTHPQVVSQAKRSLAGL